MIYLDNSATTVCSEKAIEKMNTVLRTDFGNPSSLHGMGITAEGYLRDSRSVIAKSLHAQEKEIIFTSGGSEATPVGTVCMAAKCGDALVTQRKHYPGTRSRVIERATNDALMLLLDLLDSANAHRSGQA